MDHFNFQSLQSLHIINVHDNMSLAIFFELWVAHEPSTMRIIDGESNANRNGRLSIHDKLQYENESYRSPHNKNKNINIFFKKILFKKKKSAER